MKLQELASETSMMDWSDIRNHAGTCGIGLYGKPYANKLEQ